jgi:predicted permease
MAVSGWAPSGVAPALMSGGDGLLTQRGAEAWRVMGRLRPGVTLAEARAQVEVVAKRLAETYADTHKGARVLVIPESRARPDPTFSELLPVLAVVFVGMVGLVLFIACANVANLMFSRTLGRQRELAVRAALGAGRLRLIRLQVVESVLLALVAGVFGLLLATGLGWFLASFTPTGDVPVNTEHPWDWRGFVFTALVSLAAGIGTGLWPALNASGAALSETLKEGGGGRGASSRHPFRNLLVVGQVTLSLVVLAAAALFLRSLRNAGRVALGFRPDRLLMMSVDLGLQQYEEPRAQQFLRELVEGTQALPGVRAATLAVHVPFDYGIQLTEIGSDGDVVGSKDGFVAAAFSVVRHGYLEMVGATLLRGRDLAESDGRDAPRVAVVNETLARMLWPGQDPLGRRFRFGRGGDWTEVVGLVADGKYVMLAEDARPYFYLPLAQQYRSPVTLMVRTATQPTALVKPVQDLLGRLDPDLPVFNVRSMEAHLRGSVFGLMPLRSGAALAGFQGLLGLALAVMGLYAVVSYAVGRRTQEIGVRIALGARTRDVLRLVLREGMLLTGVGVAMGLVGAAGVAVLLSHVLPGLATVDVGALLLVTLLLVAITALACYLPARRATRVDPATALRYE